MADYPTQDQENEILKIRGIHVFTVNNCSHCGTNLPSCGGMGVVQDNSTNVKFRSCNYNLCFHCYSDYQDLLKDGNDEKLKLFFGEKLDTQSIKEGIKEVTSKAYKTTNGKVFLSREKAENWQKSIILQTDWRKQANILSDSKDFQGLFDLCQQWTKCEAKNLIAWGCLGIACLALDRHDVAIKAFRKLLRLNPKHYLTWDNLGNAYLKLKKYEKAIKCYRQSVKLNSEFADSWHHLGIAYRLSYQFQGALIAFREVLRINPQNAKIWRSIGYIYDDVDKKDQAIKSFVQATIINPKDDYSWEVLGQACLESNQIDEFIKALKEATKSDPDNANVWRYLVIAYDELHQRENAIMAFEQVLRIEPDDDDASLGTADEKIQKLKMRKRFDSEKRLLNAIYGPRL